MNKLILKSSSIIIILLVLIHQACSVNKVNLPKKDLENRIYEESKGVIKLVSFNKTNGKERIL